MTKQLLKNILSARFAMLLWLPGIFISREVIRPVMNIQYSNILEAKGKVLVAVYASEADFLDEKKALLREVFPVDKTGTLNVRLNIEKEGRYAIAAFHDLNGNNKLDTNFLGVPTEPYAFSNNARPKLRAPSWAEASFDWKPGSSVVSLKLEKW